MNKHAILLGSMGGKAKARGMTPEQRSNHARKMVEAREAKKKEESDLSPVLESNPLQTS